MKSVEILEHLNIFCFPKFHASWVSWFIFTIYILIHDVMGQDARTPFFGVSSEATLKPVSSTSASETSFDIEISHVASSDDAYHS